MKTPRVLSDGLVVLVHVVEKSGVGVGGVGFPWAQGGAEQGTGVEMLGRAERRRRVRKWRRRRDIFFACGIARRREGEAESE